MKRKKEILIPLIVSILIIVLAIGFTVFYPDSSISNIYGALGVSILFWALQKRYYKINNFICDHPCYTYFFFIAVSVIWMWIDVCLLKTFPDLKRFNIVLSMLVGLSVSALINIFDDMIGDAF